MVLTVIGTGKYEKSILLAHTKLDAANILGLTVLISAIVLLVSSLILHLFSSYLGHILNEPYLKKWIFVCPILAFGIIIFGSYNEWCIRNKSFTTLSWNKVHNSAANVLSKLLFGALKISTAGLVVGELLGRTITAGICVIQALKKDREVLLKVSFKGMVLKAKQYLEFPKLYLPSELLMTVGFVLPVYLIGAFFNSVEVGYYAMTMNVLSVPISVISRAIIVTGVRTCRNFSSNHPKPLCLITHLRDK